MTKKKQHQANAEIFTATLFYLQDKPEISKAVPMHEICEKK